MDENLPLALVRWLRSRDVDADHTSALALNATSDLEIARRAEGMDAVVVTKDGDYVGLACSGRGPRVVHVRSGNLGTDRLIALFERVWPGVVEALAGGERVVEIGSAR